MSEKLPTIIKPPEVADATDDDPDSEYVIIRRLHSYPSKDVNENVVKLEIAHAQKVASIKAFKAVMLALIGAISVLFYTWLLLVT